MSSRKRRRSPVKKRRLRDRLMLYACLLLVPTILGGACGVLPHLMPERKRFGDSQQDDRAAGDRTPTMKQHFLTGAATGSVIGAAACVVVTWAGRQKKKKW